MGPRIGPRITVLNIKDVQTTKIRGLLGFCGLNGLAFSTKALSIPEIIEINICEV